MRHRVSVGASIALSVINTGPGVNELALGIRYTVIAVVGACGLITKIIELCRGTGSYPNFKRNLTGIVSGFQKGLCLVSLRHISGLYSFIC